MEWLEKEASDGIAKTASAQFEEELSSLDTKSLVGVWRQAKAAAGGTIPGALIGGAAGALGSGITGGLAGGIGGAISAPPGERSEGFWQGAKSGVIPGAIMGGLGGAAGGAMIGREAGREVLPFNYRAAKRQDDAVMKAMLAYRAADLGAMGLGAYKGVQKGKNLDKPKKEKRSSVDMLKRAMAKRAQEEQDGNAARKVVGGLAAAGGLGAAGYGVHKAVKARQAAQEAARKAARNKKILKGVGGAGAALAALGGGAAAVLRNRRRYAGRPSMAARGASKTRPGFEDIRRVAASSPQSPYRRPN